MNKLITVCVRQTGNRRGRKTILSQVLEKTSPAPRPSYSTHGPSTAAMASPRIWLGIQNSEPYPAPPMTLYTLKLENCSKDVPSHCQQRGQTDGTQANLT